MTGVEILHLWFSLLNARLPRAGSVLATANPLPVATRDRFLKENLRLQEGIGRFFASYHHFCGQCGGTCCRHIGPLAPLHGVDYRLYDLSPDHRTPMSPVQIKYLLRQFLWLNPVYTLLKLIGKVWSSLERGQENAATGSAAPASTPPPHCEVLGENGCTLPWGARPAVCVLFVCPDLLNEMSLASYLQFFWLMVRYLAHLTLSVQPRLAELRKAA